MRSPLPVAFFSIVDGVAALTQPTVTILNGTMLGSRCPYSDVNAFLSIPYANPPLGHLRFAPPQPYNQKFNGTLDATKAPPACIQFSAEFNETTPESEDCLFIDVWVPASATVDSKLPVRAWIFGGADEDGGISDGLYDGCLASSDTIQVSINYRLGPLGWLAYEGLGLTGNYGLQDQLLGLQWVQDNIAAFGGDPTRVMLFGQSAGAYNTWAISSLPQAKSLMHAAIMESGIYAPLPNLTEQSQTNEPFLKALNCTTTDLTCLRSTSANVLVTTFMKQHNPSFYGLTLDGIVIPTQPSHPLVPSIIGSTGNEGSSFILGIFDTYLLNQSHYDKFLYSNWSPAQAKLINETYPISMFSSAPNSAFAAMSLVFTYAYFRCPTSQLVSKTAAAGIPVWTYSFNHTPSCPWVKGEDAYSGARETAFLDILGATHTSELPFVFGQVSHLVPPNGSCNLTAGEVTLSETIRTAWDNMATESTPGGGWPAYTASQPMGVNIVDTTWDIGVVDYSMCDFWNPIIGDIYGTSNGTSNGTGSAVPTSGAMRIVPTLWTTTAAVLCMLPVLLFSVQT